MWSERTIRLIEAAFDEDLGEAGDITAQLLADSGREISARVVVRNEGVMSGLALAPEICGVFSRRLGQALAFELLGSRRCADGTAVHRDDLLAVLRGPRAAVLAVERTLLNFLSRMSGVATLTRRYVEAARAANHDVRIYDTRKTLPGWRELDRYAVRCGGGHNHRAGLFDAVLIKDNHLVGVPTERLGAMLPGMLLRVRGRPAFVEVEVDDLAQLAEVCKLAASHPAAWIDVVLLDNFGTDQLREAVRIRDAAGLRGKLELEASGGVTLQNVAEIAATDVERIAVGAITHSAPSLDIGLDL